MAHIYFGSPYLEEMWENVKPRRPYSTFDPSDLRSTHTIMIVAGCPRSSHLGTGEFDYLCPAHPLQRTCPPEN